MPVLSLRTSLRPSQSHTEALVNIEVTHEDILIGVPASTEQCAVAKALTRYFKEPVSLDFDIYDQLIARIGEHRVRLPDTVADWVRQFDDNPDNVLPINFTL